MTLVGIDFEMANATPGSLCAFGLAFEGDFTEAAVLRLHPFKGGAQERDRWHHISPKATERGRGWWVLYDRLKALPADTTLVAHDARIDRRELYAWFDMWNLPPLHFQWIDTLSIARREYGKQGKTSIVAMAERMGMQVRTHHAGDDALVALKIVQTYGLGNVRPLVDNRLVGV